jgi:hypothetical protein
MTLELVHIDSLATRRVMKNGKNRLVHTIAKNRPFCVEVKCTGEVSFEDENICCSLVYEDDHKDLVTKENSMQYVSHIKKGDTKSAVVEFRVFVLSSQHAHSNFSLKFWTESMEPIYSEPIRVFSKKMQATKVIQREDSKNQEMVGFESSSPVSSPPSEPIQEPSPNESHSSDQLSQLLNRFERQQKEQTAMLKKLMSNVRTQELTLPNNEDCSDFEVALRQFLRSYESISEHQRPAKIRRVLDDVSKDISANAALTDFVGHFLGSGSELSTDANPVVTMDIHGLSQFDDDTVLTDLETSLYNEFIVGK